MNFNWNWSHTRLEVEETKLVDAQPVSNVLSIGESGRQAYKSDSVTSLLSNVPHATHNDLDDGSTILTEQVDLVDDD